MKFFGFGSSLALAIAFTGSVSAQQIEHVAITDSIHMLTGDGGNIGVLIGDDGTFMIDDKFAPLTEEIVNQVKALGGETPRFIINTHFHGDHTGGNENLGELGSIIVSHANVRTRLVDGSEIKAFNMVTPPQPDVALPIITFTSNITFHLNGEKISVIHVPNAHTDGDSIVHFGTSNVIHTGDVVFNGFYPFIDTDHGGTVKGTIAAVAKILELADGSTKIIPGHGPLADQEALIAYRNMLIIAEERLSKIKSNGKSVDEVVADNPLTDLDHKWGNGIFKSDQWIRIIFDGV
ncbi:MAG: cyclase [marine bacterium B5-7]|nr:MAG: cyclase [marine bacterium B5-7]